MDSGVFWKNNQQNVDDLCIGLREREESRLELSG